VPNGAPGGVPLAEHVVASGDTLSAIAQTYLGEDDRWPELFTINQGLDQPTGWPITDPDEIDVGQIVRLPQPVVAAGNLDDSVVPDRQNVPHDPDDQSAPGVPDDRAELDDQAATDQSIETAPSDDLPETTAGVDTPTATASDSAAPSFIPDPVESDPPSDNESATADDGLVSAVTPVNTLGGVGSILAAGILLVVGRRRARQRWRRRPGQKLTWPANSDAVVERRLRLAENPDLVAQTDRALRALIDGCAETGLDLPELRAVRLTDAHIQLFLESPASLPEPWVRTVDPAVWTCALAQFDLDLGSLDSGLTQFDSQLSNDDLFRQEIDPLESDLQTKDESDQELESLIGSRDRPRSAAAISVRPSVISPVSPVDEFDELGDSDVPAPFPALVCIGQDSENAHLLVDLEQIGTLGLIGPEQFVHEAMTALAVELSTSAWADDLTVTAVGAVSDIETRLQTGCLRQVHDLEPLVETLTSQADHSRGILLTTELGSQRTQGMTALHRARVLGQASETWYPEVLVLAGPTRGEDRAALRVLIDRQPRVALAAVTTAADLMGDYRIEFQASGSAVFHPFGLPFTPQRLSDEVLEAMTRLVELEHCDGGDSTTGDAGFDSGIDGRDREIKEMDNGIDEVDRGIGGYDVLGQPADDLAKQAAGDLTKQTAGDATELLENDLTGQLADDSPEKLESSGFVRVRVSPRSPVDKSDSAIFEQILTDEQATTGRQFDSSTGLNDTPQAPYLRLLGPVELVGARGTAEPTRIKRLTEYLSYLVLHPRAVAADIDEAIWPDRSGDNTSTRNTSTSKLRRWLGDDPTGQPFLPPFTYDASRIDCDWFEWGRLLGKRPLRQQPTEALEQAFALVRGLPFTGGMRRSYRWADQLQCTMVADISDVACELGRRRCQAKEFLSANVAINTALQLNPGYERLWRLRILACYAAGDRDGLRESIDAVWRSADTLGVDLEPDTLELIEQTRHSHVYDARRRPPSRVRAGHP
jgi:hypothetical protein